MSDIFNSLIYNLKLQIKKYKKYNVFFKPAIVFDIDGTILVEGVYAPNNQSDIITDVYNFLLKSQEMGITIFIITARPDFLKNRIGTLNMLDDLGINYEYLYMWDRNIFESATIFKTMSREDIFIQGYNVLMSLGDNVWDYGDYGGLGVHIYNDGEYIEYIP